MTDKDGWFVGVEALLMIHAFLLGGGEVADGAVSTLVRQIGEMRHGHVTFQSPLLV